MKMRFAVCVVLLFAVSCRRRETVQPKESATPFLSTPVPLVKREWGEPRFAVCPLLTKEEVAEVQGVQITQTKGAGGPDGSLFISQCFYMTADRQLSVAISVIEKDPNAASNRSPLELWHEMFDQKKGRSERDKDEDEEADARRRFPPEEIAGLGSEAYWVAGALYVRKGDRVLRIAVSGHDTLDEKLRKAKVLAAKALSRI